MELIKRSIKVVVVVCCRHYHVKKYSRFIGQRLHRERKNRTWVYFSRRQDLESCVDALHKSLRKKFSLRYVACVMLVYSFYATYLHCVAYVACVKWKTHFTVTVRVSRG